MAVIIGSTKNKPWIEALPIPPHSFVGRTFSRLHILSRDPAVPLVAEIWANKDHQVASHAHGNDELLFVISGAISVDGQRLAANEVVFIPSGTAYAARVESEEGSRVLRIVLPRNAPRNEEPYEARVWNGPIRSDGAPDLGDG